MTQIGLFMNSAPRDFIEFTFFAAVGFYCRIIGINLVIEN